MAIYAIGDVQGCMRELNSLLEKLSFDPERDKLWFTGDVVNRGPDSLGVLRFIKSLGKGAVLVLGNHDLHLMAVSRGNMKHYDNHGLEDILRAPDRDDLIDWLRHRPLMHRDENTGFNLVHAGLPPQWDAVTGRERAREVEETLKGPGFEDFCQRIYGNEPSLWSDSLEGMDRLRFIVNALTRLRYCNAEGHLDLREKGPPGSQKQTYMPWYAVPNRASRGQNIIFGHWSTLGFMSSDSLWALDTGCIWGGELSALAIEGDTDPVLMSVPCPGYLKPGTWPLSVKRPSTTLNRKQERHP